MKISITPEQLTSNGDAPHSIVDFPFRYASMPYSAEAGGYCVVSVPDGWDGKMKARVTFRTSGESEVSAAFISLDFHPLGNTNNAAGYVTADVSGSGNRLVQSNIVELDCSGCSGHSFTVKVGPELTYTEEDKNVDIALVELFIGTY